MPYSFHPSFFASSKKKPANDPISRIFPRTLNKSVSESSPRNFLQHYNLGVRYSEKGMYNEALQAYLKTISVRPDFWPAHFDLANIYLKFGYKKEAILEYQKTLELNPNYSPAKEMLGILSGQSLP